MAEKDFRFERHYEVWKEQNKQVSRWIFWTAVVAPILLFKVLAPYTEFSEQVTERQKQLRAAEENLKSLEGRTALLAKVDSGLGDVRKNIGTGPWMAEKELLKTNLRELTEAHVFLLRKPVEEVRDAIAQLEVTAGRQIGQEFFFDISRTQSPMTQQIPMGQQFFQGRQLEELREPDQIVNASTVLKLSPVQLSNIQSSEQFHDLLRKQYDQRVQEEADNKVLRIVERVDDTVIKPLDELFQNNPETRTSLVRLPAMLDRLRVDMEQWKRDHVGNSGWYQTIQGKDRELHELTRFLQQRQDEFINVVQQQQEALKDRKKILTQQELQAKKEEASLNGAIADLKVNMQGLLPEWVRGFVSPQEMLQVYPFLLIVIALVVGFKVWALRHDYLALQEDFRLGQKDAEDIPSSVWTLVYRHSFSTFVTILLYIGVPILVWWLFERSVTLLMAWLSGHPDHGWFWITGGLSWLRWSAGFLFVAAFIAVTATMIKDLSQRLK